MTAITKVQASDGVGSAEQERVQTLERENELLRERLEALEGQIVVEQAKGAMSVRFGMTSEECYELMRGLAASQRRELQEFAEAVLRRQRPS